MILKFEDLNSIFKLQQEKRVSFVGGDELPVKLKGNSHCSSSD